MSPALFTYFRRLKGTRNSFKMATLKNFSCLFIKTRPQLSPATRSVIFGLKTTKNTSKWPYLKDFGLSQVKNSRNAATAERRDAALF